MGKREYEDNLPSGYDASLVTITAMNQIGFSEISPPLERLKALVYGSSYSRNGIKEIASAGDDEKLQEVRYVVARYGSEGDDLSQFFRETRIGTNGTKLDELRNYVSVIGFLRLEFGLSRGGAGCVEASELMSWGGWPQGKIGYVGSFTPHSLVPRAMKLDVQTRMLREVMKTANKEQFSGNIFAIMIENVRQFAEESGVVAEEISDARLNMDSAIVRELTVNFPGYWGNNPKLFRLDLRGV